MKVLFVLCLLLVLFVTFAIIFHPTEEAPKSIKGSEIIRKLPNFSGITPILIDFEVLQNFEDFKVRKFQKNPFVKLAIDEKLESNHGILGDFDLEFYSNSSDVDYLDFSLGERLIPKNLRLQLDPKTQLQIPVSLNEFSRFWRNSRLVKCKNIDMNRIQEHKEWIQKNYPLDKRTSKKTPMKVVNKRKRRVIPLIALKDVAELRDRLLALGATPLLFFGSLLGWYRECTILPSTNDLDFAIFANEMNDKLLIYLDTLNGTFRVWRRLGKRRDSLEFTIEHRKFRFTIDIFFLYQNGTKHYISSQGGDLQRYRFDYPSDLLKEICTAILHRHLFYVPCRAQEVIEQEYGDTWLKEKRLSDFVWTDVLNMHKNGKWNASERKKVEHFFYK